jgi:hypothetical protein
MVVHKRELSQSARERTISGFLSRLSYSPISLCYFQDNWQITSTTANTGTNKR